MVKKERGRFRKQTNYEPYSAEMDSGAMPIDNKQAVLYWSKCLLKF
jgi:hypothetical protein